jgi:hypothetical protein
MSFLPIAVLVLAGGAAPRSQDPAPVNPPKVAKAEHGKVAWFEGTFEQALAQAQAKKQLVFLDFWTEW